MCSTPNARVRAARSGLPRHRPTHIHRGSTPCGPATHASGYRRGVHVIDVLPIYGEDHEHYDAEWVEIQTDGTAHRFWWDGIRNAHTSEPITLPSAAKVGDHVVRVAIHES